MNGGGEGEYALTAVAIAEHVGGTLVGDGSIIVDGVAPLDRASRRHLTFLGVAKYAHMLASCEAGVLLVSPELLETPGGVPARVVVEKPQEALLSLLPRFHRAAVAPRGVHATAVIGS